MKTIAMIMLPLALQGYEESSQKLADDLAKADTAPAKVAVADEFVKLAKKFPKQRQEAIDGASSAYRAAWPDLDPVWKMKTRERLARLYVPLAPVPEKKLPVAGWGAISGAKADSLRVHSGSASLHLKIARKDGGLADMGGTDFFEVKPGKELELSAWVLTDGTDGLDDKFGFVLYDAAGKSLVTKELVAPKDIPAWTRLSDRFEVPAGAVKAKIGILVSSKGGDLWWDDFSVKIDGKEQLRNGGFEK